MRLELPWFDRILHPNSRPHYAAKAKATKLARTLAMRAVYDEGKVDLGDSGEIILNVLFHPPANRGDTDGMFSACKAYYDGIADALGINDRRFAFTIKRGEPRKPGMVIVTIGGE